ncbi:hypothetical protein OPW07_22365 [Vibrio europaeus]|uniref:hypothetical protein n=1 Tax=Vibrio europaeus TaxID=300876 RepID=UPI0018A75755|nr:hypothetical protein [Vibrio europaeus]MDC5812474.1 hypothetical protein [Vibrio europaeus]QPG33901.1 hypothetical protein IXK98_07205 [Vibrio europaeus]
MRKNIVTHGSCLSANVAERLSKRFGYKRASSTQHIRMDAYVESYLTKSTPVFLKKDNVFKYKDKYKFTGLIENQTCDDKFGLSLPYKSELINHRVAIESGLIDLLIVDNFPDIYFKIYKSKLNGHKLFLNNEYFNVFDHSYEFVNEFLSPDEYVELLMVFINDFKKYNPLADVVFINFPVNLNDNEGVRFRAENIHYKVKVFDFIKVIDPIGISHDDLSNRSDIHHFTQRRYSQIASLLYGEIS